MQALILFVCCSSLMGLLAVAELPARDSRCPPDEDSTKPTQLPFPGDCAKFYKCINGVATVVDCPTGMYWSTVLNRCFWPSWADCAISSNPTTKAPTTPIELTAYNPSPQCPLSDDLSNPVHFAFPGDCGKFYKCLQGVAYLLDCPTGLQWSTDLGRCDWPTVANCVSVAPATTPTQSPSIQCPAVDDVNNPVQLPYPGDCGKFYKCWKGVAHAIKCADGLHWSTTFNRCEWPYVANCASEAVTLPTLPSTISLTSSSSSEINPDTYCSQRSLESKTDYFPYPTDCRRYIRCFNGKGRTYSCPVGLFFNSKLVTCSHECA